MIGNLMDVETYERWPQDDPGQQHVIAFTLKAVNEEQAFLREATAFVRAVATALQIPISRLGL